MSSSAPQLTLPENWRTYTDAVINRCEALIESDIWSGLAKSKLNAWLQNFDTPEEEYFAARILDSLIYRSRNQTEALITQLFQRSLPDLLRDEVPSAAIGDWKSALLSKSDPNIRLVPVLTEDDCPTKSGPYIARVVKQHLSVNERWICSAPQLKKQKAKPRIIVFLDDFLGTGFQFKKFLGKIELGPIRNSTVLIYAPLVAHQRGLDRLNRALPFLKITYAEKLDDSYNLFSSGENTIIHGNTPEAMKAYYAKLLSKKGLDLLPKKILGYGQLGLAFAFEHSTPNATLPILWAKRAGFTPLFTR